MLARPADKGRRSKLRQAGSLSYNVHLNMKTPRFLLRGFRRPAEVASLALGKLEREVLERTWERREVSVRDIFLAFEERIATRRRVEAATLCSDTVSPTPRSSRATT